MKRFMGEFYKVPKIALGSLFLALMLLALPLAVLADNLINDVIVGGNDTIVAGGNTTVSYRINATGGDGQPGCNASDGTPATITLNIPPGVTASANTLVFTQCNVFQPVTFSASVPGNYAITVANIADPGPGTYRNQADFTLHVLPPPDSTPPVISAQVVGTLGNNGWYVSDVQVSWIVIDPESAISSMSGCDPATINVDTAGQTFTCTATSAGGTASQSVTIMRDATAPTISGSASPGPNGNGWNNSDVTVSFICGDNLSGVASCGPDQLLSSEGAGQSVVGTAVDHAGNSASAVVGGINIDKTPPAVTVTGVSQGAFYYAGAVPTVGCGTSDTLSGVAVPATLSITGGNGNVGTFTATCAGALDYAGNGSSASVTYSVIYNWNGFFQPVDNLPTLNRVKAGSAIPVKFSLGGNQGLAIFAPGYPKSQIIDCQTGTFVSDIEETVTAGQSMLSYEPSKDMYVYAWKTDRSWGGTCRQLIVLLNDGTAAKLANFNFTR